LQGVPVGFPHWYPFVLQKSEQLTHAPFSQVSVTLHPQSGTQEPQSSIGGSHWPFPQTAVTHWPFLQYCFSPHGQSAMQLPQFSTDWSQVPSPQVTGLPAHTPFASHLSSIVEAF